MFIKKQFVLKNNILFNRQVLFVLNIVVCLELPVITQKLFFITVHAMHPLSFCSVILRATVKTFLNVLVVVQHVNHTAVNY